MSPINARKQLTAFLKGAKKELLIYDPEISDPAMMRLIESRIKAGVDVRIIGSHRRQERNLTGAENFPASGCIPASIVRDGKQAFVGSQSLRTRNWMPAVKSALFSATRSPSRG